MGWGTAVRVKVKRKEETRSQPQRGAHDHGEGGDAQGWRASLPAVGRGYLGTSNTICTRETAATRSTLQEKRPVSPETASRAPGGHWRRRRKRHLHARQGVQAGQQVRVRLGLLAFLLPQQGQGVLEHQWGPGAGTEGGVGEEPSWGQPWSLSEAGPPAPGPPQQTRGIRSCQDLPQGAPGQECGCATYGFSFGTGVSFVAGSTRFTLCGRGRG